MALEGEVTVVYTPPNVYYRLQVLDSRRQWRDRAPAFWDEEEAKREARTHALRAGVDVRVMRFTRG